jgi:hypothetical protein
MGAIIAKLGRPPLPLAETQPQATGGLIRDERG